MVAPIGQTALWRYNVFGARFSRLRLKKLKKLTLSSHWNARRVGSATTALRGFRSAQSGANEASSRSPATRVFWAKLTNTIQGAKNLCNYYLKKNKKVEERRAMLA